MPLYEHIFLSRQDVSQSQVLSLSDQFKALIESEGGSVAKVEQWGLKPLQYRIKRNRKAHFTLMNLEAPAAAVAELERQLRINSDVIRFLTVKVEVHETEPSVMMRAPRGRDDRPSKFSRSGRSFSSSRNDQDGRDDAAAKEARVTATAQEDS